MHGVVVCIVKGLLHAVQQLLLVFELFEYISCLI